MSQDHNRKRAERTKNRITGVKFTSVEDYRKIGYGVDPFCADAPLKLINCDLSGLDLRAIDLSYTVFDACNLIETQLDVCNHAEFYSCDLRRAKLTGADLRWVKAMNCRIDGADLLGIQTTLDCHFWSGLRTESGHDAYLLLYWLSAVDNPLVRQIRDLIPERVKALLDLTFARNL